MAFNGFLNGFLIILKWFLMVAQAWEGHYLMSSCCSNGSTSHGKGAKAMSSVLFPG